MKATALLIEQHKHVEELLSDVAAGRGDPAVLLERLARDLACHLTIEQDIFYPAVRDSTETLIDTSYEEHAMMELALKRMLRSGVIDATFDAKLATLRELVLNHIEQEELELFPVVEEMVGEAALEALGAQLAGAYQEAQAQGFAALVPEGLTETSADHSRELQDELILIEEAPPETAKAAPAEPILRAAE